jgi:hypothetical protein
MKRRTLLAFSAGLGLWCASGLATTYVTKEAQAAYDECLARWKDVDGVWEGRLLTPGADVGSPYDKRIYVRLVFDSTGTTLLVKDKLRQPWRMVGKDSSPPRRKTDLSVRVQGSDPKDQRGHLLVFNRLREASATLIYSRGPINPQAGEVVSLGDMRSGVVVREGSAIPTGLDAQVWECLPK